MVRKYFFKILFVFNSLACLAAAAYPQSGIEDVVSTYFSEIEIVSAQHKGLWDLDLYAPILLVEPETRRVYSNFPDSVGLLKKEGAVYSGVLPASVNISNTSLNWNGREWAMVMLPLPENKYERLNLLAHELFHRAQKSLGFKSYNPDNNHLDQKEGRIYLRLELQALRKAASADSRDEAVKHIKYALLFRKTRYQLYPGADSTENLLELNEGLAEFTGVMMSGRDGELFKKHFTEDIDRFVTSPTYVRSFAYHTLPVYGYWMSVIDKKWNQKVNAHTDLTGFMIKSFHIDPQSLSDRSAALIASGYGADQITKEETAREEQSKKRIAGYKKKFIEDPHMELPLQNMNMSFDFRLIVPLENYGTVYPVIRVTDNWGILEVNSGALIGANWDRIAVGLPVTFGEKKISGDGWTLELKEPYLIEKKPDGNYTVRKK